MKRIKVLLSASLLLVACVMFAQTEKTVSQIKSGTVLTDADIGFLSLVTNANVDAKNRGTQEVTVSNVKYKAGSTLTASQAKSINTAIKNFQKGKYKAPDGTRGDGLCYYWYYYCDGY